MAVRECDLTSVRAAAALARPFAIIVPEDLYQFDPGEFDAISRAAAASLIRLDVRDMDPALGAQRLLVDAIFESAATGPGSGVRPAVR